MSDERNEQAEANDLPKPEIESVAAANEPGDDASAVGERRALTSDDFLVPGPSPQSNEGLARWGLTWLAFSILLILLMLCVSFACLTLANWTGIA